MDPSAARRLDTAARVVGIAAAAVVVLWFLHEILAVLLLFAFALILAIVLNAPATWLEGRGVPRVAAALGVLGLVLLVAGGLGWLIVPRLTRDVVALVESLPRLATQLADQLSALFRNYPELERRLRLDPAFASGLGPAALQVLDRVWRYSLSVLAVVVVVIVLLSIVAYMLVDPRPLLRAYLELLPERLRDPGARAFAKASRMVVGWMWANVIIGAAEAVLVFVFLHVLGIPSPILWAVLAFFAELVPRLGPYVMAIPPVVVALSIDPVTALWLVLFYWLMNQLMGDVVAPRIRASTMRLHPVFLLFVTLAMLVAFGILGALISTPIAAFIHAYYDEFYRSGVPPDPRLDERVEAMLRREV